MLLPPYLSVQNIYICPLSPLNIFLSPFARPVSAYIYSGGGDARLSQTGSSGTKTCTITSVQVLFSKLLNFNFETRFRFLYGAITALAANALQVNLLIFVPRAFKLSFLAASKGGGVPKIFLFVLSRDLRALNFNPRANCSNFSVCPNFRIRN